MSKSPKSVFKIFLYPGIIMLLSLLGGCCPQTDQSTINFPRRIETDAQLPDKDNFWIFILAGQSNMAGRGFVEPQDTIPDSRILSLNKYDKWILAKESLHYYESNLRGLDCGLSFGRALLNRLSDSVAIVLIPCAIGGTTAEQWLGDSTFRGVRLLSNLTHKMKIAKEYGTVKGILWHQGENNANGGGVTNYKPSIENLFDKFRAIAGDDNLPIISGELGSFLKQERFGNYPDTINFILREIADSDMFIGLVATYDLGHRGDFLHFNSISLRTLCKRYAAEYLSIIKLSEQRNK